MKGINKNSEPENFIKWKQDYIKLYPSSDYSWSNLKDFDDTDPRKEEILQEYGYVFEKKTLRTSLVAEQGYICCYCCRRIEDDNSTIIEHFKPKDKKQYPHLIFDYHNLFASCEGVTFEEVDLEQKAYHHCDDFKANNYENKNQGLRLISPIAKNEKGFICEQEFSYDSNGKINAPNPVSNAEFTIKNLNLNNSYLTTRRREAIEFLFDKGDMIDLSQEETEKIFKEWSELKYNEVEKRNEFSPFCNIVLFFLQDYYGVAA